MVPEKLYLSLPLFPDPQLQERVEPIAKILIGENLTIATAESLTGGLVSATLTSIPGSSAYFLVGFNTYSNQSKNQFLKVPESILETKGAVSLECSQAMATGAKAIAGSNLALSTTGIAGPSGATNEKPVGLVFITVTGDRGILSWELNFAGSRHAIAMATTLKALELLELFLQQRYLAGVEDENFTRYDLKNSYELCL
jgi:nicotinamide-nucleotide amidase